jgi:hypothetical protein
MTSDQLRLSATHLAKDVLARLPGSVQDRFGGGVRLTLNGPASLGIVPAGDGYDADYSGTIHLDTKDTMLRVTGKFESIAKQWTAEGRYAMAGSHRAQPVDFLAPLTVKGKLRGGFTLRDNVLAIDAGPQSRVTITRIAIPGLARTSGPLTLSPAKLFRARIDLGTAPRVLRLAGAVAMPRIQLAITAGPEAFDIDIAPLTLDINSTPNRLNIAFKDGAFDVPKYAIQATNIAAIVRQNDAAALSVTIGDIRQRGTVPVVVPLRLDATAALRSGKIDFSARLFDGPERLSIRAAGHHDIAANSGTVTIDAAPVTFLPTVLQPRQLFPVLGNRLRDVDGRIGGQARLQWQAGRFRSSGELIVEANALKIEGAALENATAAIVFDSLFPLSTPPGQEIRIGLLDIGVPLIKGRVEFQIGPNGVIHAALREVDFFGGRIESPTIAIPPTVAGILVPLQVTGVQLKSLLDLADIGELEATGTLNGKLTLAIEDGTVALRRGVLETAPGGGAIRYRPQSVGAALANVNEGAKLFLELVQDFKYDTVRVTLDADPSGGIASRFEIKGSNAAVYDGFPVELNITMSGPLRDILTQGIKTYTLPERLLKQIQVPSTANPAPSGN